MPRKRSPESQNERQRIQFAFNTDVDSPVGVTFQYLLKNEHARSREGKHRGVDAMMAFWKPFAYQDQGNLSEEELQAIARESIEALSRQIESIRSTFGIERSETTPASSLSQEVQQAVRDAIQTLVLGGAILPAVQRAASSGQMASVQQGTLAEEEVQEQVEGVKFNEVSMFAELDTSLEETSIMVA